jgi:hypothetical protein
MSKLDATGSSRSKSMAPSGASVALRYDQLMNAGLGQSSTHATMLQGAHEPPTRLEQRTADATRQAHHRTLTAHRDITRARPADPTAEARTRGAPDTADATLRSVRLRLQMPQQRVNDIGCRLDEVHKRRLLQQHEPADVARNVRQEARVVVANR